MTLNTLYCTFLATILILSGCKKKEEEPQPSPGSSTYNFSNVNYTGQTTRMDMLEELIAEMETGQVSGTQVDGQKLKDMYANQNNPFTNSALNTSGLQLKDNTYSADQIFFENLMDSVAKASLSTSPATNGGAGVLQTKDFSESFLLNAYGFDYAAMIEKGLMGAIIYYQATSTFLSSTGIGPSVDNTTVISGEGTAMEHHWDEAFGYFGVPIDFPANTTGARFFGGYTQEVNASLGSNAVMMNAFISGRSAISSKDMTTKDAQASILISEWEKLVAASAIHELNEAKANLTDDALRNHVISEGIGFVMALKYNPNKTITQTQINTIVGYFGTNLYNLTVTDINNAINDLSTIYGFDSIKATL